MAVSQAVARPVRTGVQLLSAGIIVELVDSTFWDMTERQYGAMVAFLTMVIGFVQVIVEDRAGKAFLREPSPPEQAVAPVEERGVFRNDWLVAAACVAIVVFVVVWLLKTF